MGNYYYEEARHLPPCPDCGAPVHYWDACGADTNWSIECGAPEGSDNETWGCGFALRGEDLPNLMTGADRKMGRMKWEDLYISRLDAEFIKLVIERRAAEQAKIEAIREAFGRGVPLAPASTQAEKTKKGRL